jgi:HSP20 family protein
MEDKVMLARINRTYPNLFDEFFRTDFYPVHYRMNGYKSLPAVNISEGDNGFTIEIAAPGLEKKDFKIDLDNDVLTIASAREDKKEESGDHFTRREFGYSSFSRSFNLPETVDAEGIAASHKNGILSVSIPKKEEARPQPVRKIAIK